MTHPYSIHIWQPAQTPADTGAWVEALQAYSEEFALYVANLLYHDSQAVIKVIGNDKTLACFPDEQTVARIERQMA